MKRDRRPETQNGNEDTRYHGGGTGPRDAHGTPLCGYRPPSKSTPETPIEEPAPPSAKVAAE